METTVTQCYFSRCNLLKRELKTNEFGNFMLLSCYLIRVMIEGLSYHLLNVAFIIIIIIIYYGEFIFTIRLTGHFYFLC